MKIAFSHSRYLAVLLVCAAVQACNTQSSSTGGPHGEPIPTNSMYLNARVEAQDNSVAVVSVRVNDGYSIGTQYRLDGGDYFRACVGAQCRSLIDDYTQLGAYIPFFPIGYANRLNFLSDTDYVVSFTRPDARNAPNSRVSLPSAFSIDTPAHRQQVTDGEIVTVSWSPAGTRDLVEVSADADCRHLDGQRSSAAGLTLTDANADGREEIRIDDIVGQVRTHTANPSPLQRCDIDIVVTHERRGSVDAAFRGGYIVGVVSRKIVLDYLPR